MNYCNWKCFVFQCGPYPRFLRAPVGPDVSESILGCGHEGDMGYWSLFSVSGERDYSSPSRGDEVRAVHMA